VSPDEITMRDLMDASLRAIDASIYALREQVISGQQAATTELAGVRGDIAELRGRFDKVATDEELRTFKDHVYRRLEPLEADMHERAGGIRARTSLLAYVVAGSGVMGVVAGLAFTLIRSFVPAA
jgi:hypothetical protein